MPICLFQQAAGRGARQTVDPIGLLTWFHPYRYGLPLFLFEYLSSLEKKTKAVLSER